MDEGCFANDRADESLRQPRDPKAGMSGTAKVLMVFGIGFVVLAVLCCGGVGFFGYWGYNLAKNAMSQIRRRSAA